MVLTREKQYGKRKQREGESGELVGKTDFLRKSVSTVSLENQYVCVLMNENVFLDHFHT